MIRNLRPTFVRDYTQRGQFDMAFHHLAEEGAAFSAANGHEIRTDLRIIVTAQPDGSTIW